MRVKQKLSKDAAIIRMAALTRVLKEERADNSGDSVPRKRVTELSKFNSWQ